MDKTFQERLKTGESKRGDPLNTKNVAQKASLGEFLDNIHKEQKI